jgi:hypothetical protein
MAKTTHLNATNTIGPFLVPHRSEASFLRKEALLLLQRSADSTSGDRSKLVVTEIHAVVRSLTSRVEEK